MYAWKRKMLRREFGGWQRSLSAGLKPLRLRNV
jgi:hypothetical protein